MTEYLTFREVVQLHDEILAEHGGLSGIRDENSLWSALDAPKAALFGMEMYPTFYEKAAVYMYHLVCNHPFNDANKRTSYALVRVFFIINEINLNFEREALENLVLEVAAGRKTKDEVIAFFMEMSKV